jgi:hypothetical protein
MANAQQPLVQIGDTIDASGHRARITAIEQSGITARLCDGSQREVKVDLDQVEKAIRISA